jgi:hypothetical protein
MSNKNSDISLTWPLTDIISVLHLDWVNDKITDDNFPTQLEDNDSPKAFKEFKLGPFSSLPSEEAIASINEKGFRPATLRELLKWATENWNSSSSVIALGTRLTDSNGFQVVPILSREASRKMLDLDLSKNHWSGFSFLAVRK